MAAVSRLGLHGGPRANIGGGAAVVSAVVTGTAVSGLTESDVVSGGKTIIITLTNDTWVASGATFNAQRQNIIDGLDSAQSETTGWNAEVRDKEVVTAVARTSDTVVTITLTAAAAYDVTSDETITVTIPATALTGGTEVVASPTIGVTAAAVVEEDTGGGGSRKRVTWRKGSKQARRIEMLLRRRAGLPEEIPESKEEDIDKVAQETAEHVRQVKRSGASAKTVAEVTAEGVRILERASRVSKMTEVDDEEEEAMMLMIAA